MAQIIRQTQIDVTLTADKIIMNSDIASVDTSGVGATEGDNVGDMVGDTDVGLVVGADEVGATEGDTVGDTVGDTDGRTGDNVG